MLKLRLLGNATLQDDDRSLSGRAVQPRRLALLALVALAPRKSLSREKVLAYLWPESDTEQGRHLLSVAVYELRKAIGDAALITGRDEVSLSSEFLSIDVEEFDAALAAGEFERAISLYAGPLLDGFHINDAPEFERWLDAQRAHLDRCYAEALNNVAQARASAGDAAGAVAAWRRLSEHEPYSARVVCGLMQALEAAGDRAGALQHARAHAALMKEEFGAEPDPEVTALADRLRTTPRVGAREAAAAPVMTRPSVPAQAPATQPSVIARAPVPVDVSQSQKHARRRRRARWSTARLLALAVMVLAITGFVWWRMHDVHSGTVAATPPENISIAVLPFDNLTPSDTAGDFSSGVTDEIISALGRVMSLNVVSRTSSFAVNPHLDVREVGRILGVGHVLEGTVRRLGADVRVTARLINTRTGYTVWSKDYDKNLDAEMRNVLAIQEQIAHGVVAELARQFGRSLEYGPATATLPRDVEALEMYSAGKRYFHRRTVPNLQKALQHYDLAIAQDSNYALAYAGKAEVFAVLGAYDYGALAPSVAFTSARAGAERALELDPNLAEAHSALASVLFNYDWNWAGAEREYLNAIKLSPGYATARHWYSLLLLAQRRNAEALEQIIRAGELDPLSSVTSTGLARHFYMTRKFGRAIAEYQQTIASDPSFVTAHVGLGLSYAAVGDFAAAIRSYEAAGRIIGMPSPLIDGLLANAYGRNGQMADAARHLKEVETVARSRYVPPEYLYVAHIGMGNTDAAFAALDDAIANRSSGVVYLDVEPIVDPIRNDPRFAVLLKKVGIPRR